MPKKNENTGERAIDNRPCGRGRRIAAAPAPRNDKTRTVWRTVNTKDRKRPGAVSSVENLGYTPAQIASLKAHHWKIVKEERKL